MALAFDQDPAVAHEVATNAVENNFWVVAYYGALAGLAAYEGYQLGQTARHEGLEAAAQELAVDMTITAATGGAGKGAHSALKAYLKHNPAAKEILTKGTAKVTSTLGRLSAKGAKRLTRVNDRFDFKSSIFNQPVEWTAPSGTKQTYKVYTRNDIDWGRVRTDGDMRFIGKTNREAAEMGVAPQLKDGKFATLHHIGQNAKGPLVEASTKHHGIGNNPGQRMLHNQFGPNKGNPNFPIDRQKFRIDAKKYWQSRINKSE